MSSNSAEQIPALNGLRAISILLVLAAHMLPLGPKNLQLTVTAGAMGMSLFFVLSGFLITSALLGNPSVGEFMIKRLARILPLAYLYVFVVFVLMMFNPGAAFWTATFTINYLGPINEYNWHFWSLCVEVQFYCGIAFAVWLGGRSAIWLLWPLCVAITLLRIHDGAFIDIRTHLRVDEILAGACVATVFRGIGPGALRLPFPVAAAAAVLWLVSSHPKAAWVQYLRPYAAAAVLAVTLCQGDTWLARILASPPLRYVARVSYALYVIHPITYAGWLNEGGVLERYAFKRPISFILTFAAAHLSTFYWERPWQQGAKRWIERRKLSKAPGAAPAT